MEETRKRRRLSESGSFKSEAATTESTKNETKAEESNPAVSRQPRRTLFVRSLPASATNESLTEYFSQSYVLKHATVVVDPQTKKSKGYGFVTFADIEDAKRALEEFNGSNFDGRKIKVDFAEPRHREIDETIGKSVPAPAALKLKEERARQKEQQAQPPKLIVRNLPWSIKEPDDLAAHFRSFGKVKQAILPKKGKGLAGFGFVVMRGRKNAERALEAVNGKEIDGRTVAVDWAVEKSVWEQLQKSNEENADKAESASGDEKEDGDAVDGASEDMDERSDAADDDDEEDVSMKDDEESAGDDDEDEDEEDEDDEDEEEEEEEDERNASTVFIRNLPYTATDESLYEHFSQFGRLRYARIVLDPETERPRGTGFVCFREVEDAVACLRDAPKPTETIAEEARKANKTSTALKHSVLQDENADPTGRYIMDGRVLQVTRAVSRSQAAKLQEEGAAKRFARDKDKRRLFLLSEGTIPSNSELYKKLSPSEIKMREDSLKQRQALIKNNPTLHLSLTRLSVRNIPRNLSSKELKALAREAVVGFAKDVKAGLRQPLSKEELQRSADAMKEAEKIRKKKGQGIVKQAKIVFEGRDGSKIDEKSGAGRSRGYGFIEYATHRHALMGLRWLNGHLVEAPAKDGLQEKKKRLIVEFAIENAQVVKRRQEQQARQRALSQAMKSGQKPPKDEDGEKGASQSPGKSKRGVKRKRSEGGSDGKGTNGDAAKDQAEAEKIAKRNRIIAKKRMQRKARKRKA
ncbi:hypothetical protein VTN02DRAFT_5585 [Thermoascus thermophilus]